MSKKSSYIITFAADSNITLDIIKSKLGWGKNETVLRLIQLFEPIVKELKPNRDLVLTVKDAKTNKIIEEKVYPYEALNSPQISE